MAGPMGFDAEAIASMYYDNPTDLETLVIVLAHMIKSQTGEAATASQVGDVFDKFAADAHRVPPKGGFKGFLEEISEEG